MPASNQNILFRSMRPAETHGHHGGCRAAEPKRVLVQRELRTIDLEMEVCGFSGRPGEAQQPLLRSATKRAGSNG